MMCTLIMLELVDYQCISMNLIQNFIVRNYTFKNNE